MRSLVWSSVKGLIRRKFPDVSPLSPTELATWLASDRPNPILIDVRQPAEYAVSHLPGARHLPSLAAIQQAHIGADAALVLYCSVGYRSARLASQLQANGFQNVMNLEGSLFAWANEGRPIVAGGEVVDAVHPYNRTWGFLLDSSR